VHRMLLAGAISPDNTPHGYNLTFAFPMLMFIIIAGALYLRFRSTHRVPGHGELTSSRWASTTSVAHGATLDAAAGETTPGSTLHEGTPAEEAEGSRSEGTEGNE
jgi:hypothetical protein